MPQFGTPRVLSIIDWEQAGWFPAYWEFAKARNTQNKYEDWRLDYVREILPVGSDYELHADYLLDLSPKD